VTGEAHEVEYLHQEVGSLLRPQDRLVCGNWEDSAFLSDETFDVVVADYLIGAIERIAPRFQSRVLERLHRHMRGRLYAIGMEPLADLGRTPACQALLELLRLRDATNILGGHRCYREYPADWLVHHLRGLGTRILDVQRFPIVFGSLYVQKQADVALRRLKCIANPELAEQMHRALHQAQVRTLRLCEQENGIRMGADWVVSAESQAVQ
jgi:hypothetical protein